MRWLQWSTIDLERGLGGVEVHARSLARELQSLGVEHSFSSDPRELSRPGWDVVQTHGSAAPLAVPRTARGTVRVHTLHGTTLGRMIACREWGWPGGYAAAAKEAAAVARADVVLAVHPGLSLLKLARRLGKECAVCWNGWDAAAEPEALPASLVAELERGRPFWAFVGRGGDRVKGADRLLAARVRLEGYAWVAAPGEGFESAADVTRTGPLSNGQVRTLLDLAQGLVLPSRYEGNSLVVLEALAAGVPVVSTRVGSLPVLPKSIQGLTLARSGSARGLAWALSQAGRLSNDPAARGARARANRALLPTWKDVARVALSSVESFRRKSS